MNYDYFLISNQPTSEIHRLAMSDPESEYHRERFEEEKRDFEKQLDSISNPPLGSLPDLYHSSQIRIPICSSERYIHGIDLLNALSCYDNNVALHNACAKCAQNGIIPIIILLDEGVDINLCNESGVTAFECFAKYERRTNRINEIVRHFFKRVHKLIATGLDVHQQNRRQYDIVRSREDMRSFVDQQLSINYEDELSRMQDVQLEGRYTLRDVLREETDLTPMMNTIKEMIKDDSFARQFPRLWCLVKLRYRQFATRIEWKPLVMDALRILTRRQLPPNCVDIITKQLKNYDLADLLTVSFNVCLRNYKIARRNSRRSDPLSILRSPRKMLPRI